jgi:hypothetical protein
LRYEEAATAGAALRRRGRHAQRGDVGAEVLDGLECGETFVVLP